MLHIAPLPKNREVLFGNGFAVCLLDNTLPEIKTNI
ncbi:hypothetical protein CJ739_647 [Mariniflexile rhizosphaerae]|nr:hypothetical protein CJ739_647 [Mariniflexile sp. TRM1-10]